MTEKWHIYRLGDVATIKAGSGFPLRYQGRTDGPFPFYKVSDMSLPGNEREMRQANNTVTEEERQQLGAYKFPKGTTLFPKIGGAIATNKKRLATRECCVDNNVMGIVPRPGLIDSEFLYYFFLGHDLADFSNRAHLPSITGATLQNWELRVPPLDGQRRIVAILDEAFDAIATAKANAEKNLQNARELFESHLNAVFTQRGAGVEHGDGIGAVSERRAHSGLTNEPGRVLGKKASERHIPGKLSLSVGMPSTPAKPGWRWVALSDVARLESGHTPSRRHPEYWGGSIPWIGIQDARKHHGGRIQDTAQKTNELGIANSSARILPANTVCLTRTASVGYVIVTERPMATSQDFVNWICSEHVIPDFLKFLFLAETREGFLKYASGSVHQTIYFPEVMAFHICLPEIFEQERIVRLCERVANESKLLEDLYHRKLAVLDELKQSLLHQAFSGNL